MQRRVETSRPSAVGSLRWANLPTEPRVPWFLFPLGSWSTGLALLLITQLSACASPAQRAQLAYAEARYADATAFYRSVDRSALPDSETARVALYSGLSELSLGNLGRAVPQLSLARCALERAPHVYSSAERGRLEAAWQSIGRMPSQPLVGKGSVARSCAPTATAP